jgi:hypothetical protein
VINGQGERLRLVSQKRGAVALLLVQRRRARAHEDGRRCQHDWRRGIEVAKLDLNKQVGKPDPRNAKFGEVLNHWLAYGKTKTGEDKDAEHQGDG